MIARSVSSSTVKPSWALNRAARSIRSGSSPNDTRGSVGVRSTPATRSSTPPVGSTSFTAGTWRAIALTVKSRRTRSPSIASPNSTVGLRVTPS
ncbi:Uncharacterised protein [Mycobacterium tuberculosis]|nr:Uncharacterised protein [Mycobacterium tuberculosis]